MNLEELGMGGGCHLCTEVIFQTLKLNDVKYLNYYKSNQKILFVSYI